MKKFKDLLIDLNACEEAVKWAWDKTIEEAVAECPRGDWLLWLAYAVKIDPLVMTKAKALCANTVRHLMKDERSTNAIDLALRFADGKAT